MSAPGVAIRPLGRTSSAPVALLPEVPARLGAFAALTLFAALHWFTMTPEDGTDPRLAIVAMGIGLAAALGVWVPTLPARARRPVALGLAIGATLLALVVTGLPAKLLLPNHWDDLGADLGRGFDTLPRVNVPYDGINDWTRLIIALGGTLLVMLAAALAFWPGGRARSRLVALVLLVTLYTTPSVEITFSAQYLRGAALALLAMGFLWIDRVPAAGGRIAGTLAALAAAGGLVVAPALDGGRPWIDYEHLANSVGAGSTVAFSWDHTYGPLVWSREGREVLRIKARHSAYWKAENLDDFDGVRWESPRTGWQPGELSENVTHRRQFLQTIDVLVRGMRSNVFIGAGTTVQILDQPQGVDALPIGGIGAWTADRVLRRGDAWRARVYTPRPTVEQLRSAGSATDVPSRFLALSVPPSSALRAAAPRSGVAPASPPPLATVLFPVFGGDGTDTLVEPGPELASEILRGGATISVASPDYLRSVLDRSAYSRAYELALRLRARADTPYDYVKSVERYFARGYLYDEIVPSHPVPLESFIFNDKRGYCQQFSGAMALLLRMGGVPGRVVTGFTPGSLDKSTGEYVVRDVDAHSWVEAWFPGWGWVPFDPTPTTAPARSQAGTQAISAATGDTRDVSKGNKPVELGGSSSAGGGGDGSPWVLPAALGLFAVALLSGALLVGRRRRADRSPDRLIDELERALRRAGHAVDPADTLRSLERRVAVSSGAVAYLRAVAAARYGDLGTGPTRAQRRALRGALGHGLGPGGRLRAWWAVPPRLH